MTNFTNWIKDLFIYKNQDLLDHLLEPMRKHIYKQGWYEKEEFGMVESLEFSKNSGLIYIVMSQTNELLMFDESKIEEILINFYKIT